MDYLIKKIIKEEVKDFEEKGLEDMESNEPEKGEEIELPLETDPPKGIVAPSQKVISDVCEKEKFCKKQGPITFGQLRTLVETAQNKNLTYDIGEGVYKALIRLIPWFFPQIAVAGFVGSSIRAFNKIIKPGLEDTRGYKKWWGRTLMYVMDAVEGDIPHEDPISKIFFISDGLLHMMDRKFKLKFARYIAELAASKPDDEPVPEYFVENELRKWVNQKFLLNPPLPPKTMNESKELDDIDWMRGDIETPLKDFKDLGYELTDIVGFNVRLSENSRFYNDGDDDNPIEEVGIINEISPFYGDGLPIQVKWPGQYRGSFTNSYSWDDLIVVNQGNKLNESEEDPDWGWAKEIEVQTDLTPAQIYNRYQTLPVEVVGPYIAGQFSDVVYEGGRLYLETSDWCDFVDLFEDRDSGYGYMSRYLAKAVLCDGDYWEPYSTSDLVNDWVDDVWDLVTDDPKLLEYIKKHIKENGFIGQPLDSEEILTEEMLNDNNLLGNLIDEEDMFHDLKMELKWAYGSAYNQAASNNVYEAATDAIIDIFGKFEWVQKKNRRGVDIHVFKFDATDVILESLSNEISNCWSICRGYFDLSRHYDSAEHESEEQAFEEYCEECIDKPFDDWGSFIDFYSKYLYDRNDELYPRYNEYPDNSDLKEYFREDVYGRI
jgi:hypothetical protein